ncbi:hypothetical protein BDK92_5474 [Micromonospora pisi]|uniref:Regulatory LuxR family protein n=1 Tax=Micromonospora pisi TaxID=589240 RepID=A0A495JQ38_9ACTN|nr:hypothetical protein [Micromonospora pisi]RKR91086.1 hypothetical protein BDK92_5474 [Micromonospora pisi]
MVDTADADDIPRLTEAASRAYAWAVAQRSISPERTHHELGLDNEDTDKALRLLKRLGLLRAGSDDTRQLVAVPPKSAKLQVLGPMLREMQAAQQRIEQIQADLDALVPAYEEGVGRAGGRHDIEQLVDPEVTRTVIAELVANAQEDVLVSQPGRNFGGDVVVAAMSHARELVRRRVRIRVLLQHTSQFNQGVIAAVEEAAALGVRVRTTPVGCARMLVADASTAVFPRSDRQPGIVLVHEPSVVEFAVESFVRTWAAADEFPLRYDSGQVTAVSSEVRRAIVMLLVEGESDKRIAERVGLSLRSCQRHIADLMKDLGARSRLHAGFLLSRELTRVAQPAPPEGSLGGRL